MLPDRESICSFIVIPAFARMTMMHEGDVMSCSARLKS